jgi:hypothetical protein
LTKLTRNPAVRSLKIEAEGDLWKGIIKPKIRLIGRWLERAGFCPGLRVQVRCLAPGVIELRSAQVADVIWRGWQRLMSMCEGLAILSGGGKSCG